MRTTDTMITTAAAVVGLGMLCAGATHAAGTPQQTCEQAKVRAQAKYHTCVAKAQKNDIKVDGQFTSDIQTYIDSICLPSFTEALAKVDAKASAAGASCRYVDNGDGTLSDLNTGLVWEKKDNLDGTENLSDPHDADNQEYKWSTGSPYNPDGSAFSTFLYALNGVTTSDGTDTVTACFAGHCDWRLPTIQELEGIVDTTQGFCGGGSGPCIDPAFGPTGLCWYWSATSDSSFSSDAWILSFCNGVVTHTGKVNTWFVRAVRGGL